MDAKVFRACFAAAWEPEATAAGLTRTRRDVLKWTHRSDEGHALSFGFRLNRKNLAGWPGEFMPDISWSGPQSSARDTGEVSFFQYTRAEDTDAVASLQRGVVQRFLGRRPSQILSEPGTTLARLLAEACDLPIRPNHARWLPYWDADDAAAWGQLFGASIDGWMSRFLASPETLEAWCRRTLWSQPGS